MNAHMFLRCLALLDGWKMQELGIPRFLIYSHARLIEAGCDLLKIGTCFIPQILKLSLCNFWLLVISRIVAGQQGTCAGGRRV